MTTPAAAAGQLDGPVADRQARSRRFLRARLGTLFAVLPLGVWTAFHLWHNLASLESPEAWQEAVTGYRHPVARYATLLLVLGPLLYHAAWGLGRLVVCRPTWQYRSYSNLKFLLQRLSALGVLLFVGAHLWLAMIEPRFLEGHAESFADIAHEMRFNPPTLVVYLLGTLGVSYHLANGLQTALMKLGMRWSRRPDDPLERPFLLLFVTLLAASWAAIYGLYRAGV